MDEEKKENIVNDYYEKNEMRDYSLVPEIKNENKKAKIKYSTEIDKPPLVLAIQGGKGSGKTTLIKSLVKYYTNQNITKVNGSITIRNSKNQRITLIKCPNDINGLDDCAKIADVAITLIDARIGFEMDTFEFISLLKNHGFTSVMGVITHMDDFKQNKSLSKYKKQIKKRFLKDATDRSKLFYLYGIKNNLYIKQQLHTMARFLKTTNPNTPLFRINHPYVICDRYDITFTKNSNDNEDDDVMVSFFGYVRGAHFNKNVIVHINGLGDYNIDFMNKMDDPCPIEIVEKNGKKKRTLKQKDKTLYAPYCNVNTLEYDRKSGYINIPEKLITFTKGVKENEELANDEGVKMVRQLQDIQGNIDNNIDDIDMEIIGGVNIEKEKIKKNNNNNNLNNNNNRINQIYDKNFNLVNEPNFFPEKSDQILMNDIYNKNENNEMDLSVEEDILSGDEILDTYKDNENKNNYELEFLIKNGKQRFITGAFDIVEEEDENEIDTKKKDKEENDEKKDLIIPEETTPEEKEKELNEQLKPFLDDPSKYNIYQFGSYVRIDIKKIKRKYVNHFSPNHPIVLASLSLQEQETKMGFLKIKFIKHLWYPKILKTNDPIILSIGWRRFQTIMSFCVEDKNTRLRLVKYTPKFGSVTAICYGPLMPINIAVIAFQNNLYDKDIQNFRICGKGDLIEVNESFNLVKKIKLIGEAEEIYKKSAIIKGMFNSNLEVARYIGAKIQTVSGIRGIIKKQINLKPEGRFRATFEDKIKKSDVIFLKQWTQVQLYEFYNPIIQYDDKPRKFLRTMSQLRKDYNIELKQNPDSEYKEIVREEQVFPDLVISKNLEKNLPFKTKNKIKQNLNDEAFHLKKLGLPYKKQIKSYLTTKEKNVYSLIQRLQTLQNIKEKNLKIGAENYKNKLQKEEEKQEQLRKKRRREKMIKNIKKKKK